MAKTEGRKKAGRILRTVLLCMGAVLLCAALAFAGMIYMKTVQEREEALAALAERDTELSLRRMVQQQRRILALTQEEETRQEEENRIALKESFLARDRERRLMLVNSRNPLPEDVIPQLVDIGDGMQMDERAAGALANMLRDCRKTGIMPVPISGYRTQEYQQGLFDNKLQRVIATGLSGEDAVQEAAKSVALPGTSEHQLGLSMDILDVDNPDLDNSQEWTPTQQWLMKHCYEYGFILRYPNGTSELTGIIYEPWHYRYVGRAVAEEITSLGITLEEYVEGAQAQ